MFFWTKEIRLIKPSNKNGSVDSNAQHKTKKLEPEPIVTN
jgi:hypothetical protein